MGRDSKTKTDMEQEKVKLKAVQITWTSEEIVAAKKEGWFYTPGEDISYDKLRRPFVDMMNKHFEKTKEYLNIGTGFGYYFVCKRRLIQYLDTILDIIINYGEQFEDNDLTMMKADIRAQMKKLVPNKKEKTNPPISGFDLIGLCSLFDECRKFSERKNSTEKSCQELKKIEEDLSSIIIVNTSMDWYNGMDVLGLKDPVSLKKVRNLLVECRQSKRREKWREAILMDMSKYKYEKYIGELEKIHPLMDRIRGIRLDNMSKNDQKFVAQQIIEGNDILEYYINVLTCLEILKDQDQTEYMPDTIFQEERDVMCNLYMSRTIEPDEEESNEQAEEFDAQNQGESEESALETKVVDENNLGELDIKAKKSESNSEGKGSREYDQAASQFQKNFEILNDLKFDNLKLKNNYYQDIADWLDRFCYIMDRIRVYRKFETMLNSKTEEEKKKMDIKILGETFGELYDSHKPERKQLAIDIEGYSD